MVGVSCFQTGGEGNDMRKPARVASGMAVALALSGCGELKAIPDIELDADAAVFEPAALTLEVGRGASLALRIHASIDEVNLRCPVSLTLSDVSCEPASSCTVEQLERVGIDYYARVAVRRANAVVKMRVTGASLGRSHVGATVFRPQSCGFSFLSTCTPAAQAYTFVPVVVVP